VVPTSRARAVLLEEIHMSDAGQNSITSCIYSGDSLALSPGLGAEYREETEASLALPHVILTGGGGRGGEMG